MVASSTTRTLIMDCPCAPISIFVTKIKLQSCRRCQYSCLTVPTVKSPKRWFKNKQNRRVLYSKYYIISNYIHTYTLHLIPIELGRDHSLPLATILTHAIRIINTHQCFHTSASAKVTLDVAFDDVINLPAHNRLRNPF